MGTSGWHYKHWIESFYPARFPASKMLEFYSARFNTVELNNSFYHLPSITALEAWRDGTPADFLFAVKGSRFLTHMKKLKDPALGIHRFFERVDTLREKLGPVLFQLPPGWNADPERLDVFLRTLPPYHRYAFEFRNESWNTDEVIGILREHRAAYCIFDLAGYHSPLTVTTDFVYVRLHGPGGKYQGSYSQDALSMWASRIAEWRRSGISVYVYFDNDDSGFAPRDAAALLDKIGR